VSMGAVTSLLTTSLALMTIQRAGGIAGFVKGQDEAHKIYHAVIKPTLDDLGMDTMTPHKDFLSNNRFSDVAYPRVIADLDNLSRDDLEIMARDITIDQDTQYQWARQNNKFWQTTPTVDADGIWSKKRDAFEANVETAIKHRLSSGRGFVGGLRALGFSPS